MFILSFIWLNVLTQVLLLLVWWKAGHLIIAVHSLYAFSPALFSFYALSLLAIASLLWAWLRAYVLLAETGRKSRRAASTRGFPVE